MIKEIRNYQIVRPFDIEDAKKLLALAKNYGDNYEVRLYLADYMAVNVADYKELSPEDFVTAINSVVIPL